MSEITTIRLDLAKHVFQVHGIDAEGTTVLRKRLRRGQVLAGFQPTSALHGGAGSVCDGSSMILPDARSLPHGLAGRVHPVIVGWSTRN